MCGLLPGSVGASLARPAAAPLAGTQWRLVAIESMDDAQGLNRPADPSRYTLRFDANGTWSARPGADPSSGRLSLGPLATTRALCPPPSLGERIGAQAPFVRGYRLRDGRLHLSLLADGGILVWEPLRPGGQAPGTPDPKLEAAILHAWRNDIRLLSDQERSGWGRYVHGRYDLNGDGREEVIAYLMGSIFCGTGGCTLQLFQPNDKGYRLMNTFSITRLPVIIAPKRTRGWHDLWKRESGGGAPATWVRHVFDGRRYVEKERVPAEPTPAGTAMLSGDPSFADGIPLVPGR